MHEPVLVKEAVELLSVASGCVYIDGTLGRGGHSEALLEAAEGVLVIGIDRDTEALERSRERLKRFGDRVYFSHAAYADMQDAASEIGFAAVDGVLLDLGVSSEQLDEGRRGFSFRHDGPLDMRMDPTRGETAEEVIKTLGETELADIFRDYGEERRSMPVARAIVRERDIRPIRTTGDLAQLVERAVGGRRGKIHPATRVFQALRIYVNRELDQLSRGLEAGLDMIKPGGRFAVITYHSLEDRLVKRFFRDHEGRWESLQAGGSEWIGVLPAVRRVNRKPVIPTGEEISRNSRARSAKLRVVEKV